MFYPKFWLKKKIINFAFLIQKFIYDGQIIDSWTRLLSFLPTMEIVRHDSGTAASESKPVSERRKCQHMYVLRFTVQAWALLKLYIPRIPCNFCYLYRHVYHAIFVIIAIAYYRPTFLFWCKDRNPFRLLQLYDC